MEHGKESASLSDADWVLLGRRDLETLSAPDAGGVLERRSGLSGLSGWHAHWFSLRGSVLRYFHLVPGSARRGALAGTVLLFRHRLRVLGAAKRVREFEIVDAGGRTHALRARTDAELHGWVAALAGARNTLPPAQPLGPLGSAAAASKPAGGAIIPPTAVDAHLHVDHLLCVVHGIGASQEILSNNVRQLLEAYADVMAQVLPDVDFRAEMLVVQWRESLMRLDVHDKLQGVVPISAFPGDVNPLRDFMADRIVDYVYYTHARYRRHIMREVVRQMNEQVSDFRQRHPEFNGRISVYAHSLGAALVYDLLCRKIKDDQTLLAAEGLRINFDVDNLFLVGSPLATFLHLDPSLGLGVDIRKLPFRMYNIFHPNDPLATRLEPMVDPRMCGVPPVCIPYWVTMGRCESTARWLGTLWPKSSASSTPSQSKPLHGKERPERGSTEPPAPHPSPATIFVGEPALSRCGSTPDGIGAAGSGMSTPGGAGSAPESDAVDNSAPAKAGDRLRERSYLAAAAQGEVLEVMSGSRRADYGLQITSTMEEVSTSYSALRAHTEYWGNRDGMLLVISAMIKSSFGISDTAEGLSGAGEVERLGDHVIDKDFSQRELKALDRAGNALRTRAVQTPESIERIVCSTVEKLFDDVAALTELTTQHPHVRLAGAGGVTSVGKIHPGDTKGQDNEAQGSANASPAPSSWAAYLPWFKDKPEPRTLPSAAVQTAE